MWSVRLALHGAGLDSARTAQLALRVLEGSPVPWGPLEPQSRSLRSRALLSMLHCTGGSG